MKRILRWLASKFPLRQQARFVAWLLPNRYWYRGALAITRLQGALVGLLGGNRKLTEAVMLDHWLFELTVVGAFPIPYVVNGLDIIQTGDEKIGTLYCWIHEPLVEFPVRTLVDLGRIKIVVVADPGRIVDGDQFLVVGTSIRLMAIPNLHYVLGRVKSALLNGVSVECLINEYMAGPIYPQVLRLAGRIGARVVFGSALRRPDDTIEVNLMKPPRPDCETEEAVQENLAYLRAAEERMLREFGLLDQETT
ncbi:MAG: hypothetical protein ABI209_07400 [Edaphobacter sp.]